MKEAFATDDALVADIEQAARRAGAVDIWWLGQSGFLFHHRGRWVLVDPYLSDSLTVKYANTDRPHVRMMPRVIEPAALARAFGAPITIVSTHAHTDHMDPETLRPLIASGLCDKLIFPKSASQIMFERSTDGSRQTADQSPVFEPADGGSKHQIGHGIQVDAVASAHAEIERDSAGCCKYLGYVFEFRPSVVNAHGIAWMRHRELVIYHSGDTVRYDGMVERLRPFNLDLALLPINGKLGNLNGAEAAKLAKDIGAKLVIPCHYDMFEFNTADPYEQFVPECERIGQAYRVLRLGERLTLQPRES